MASKDLVATKAFRYGGRALTVGDSFEARGRDARILTAIGKASEVPAEEKAKAEELDQLRADYVEATGSEPDKRWGPARLTEEIEKATVPKKQSYQRRDLRAED